MKTRLIVPLLLCLLAAPVLAGGPMALRSPTIKKLSGCQDI